MRVIFENCRGIGILFFIRYKMDTITYHLSPKLIYQIDYNRILY
jgi:hypothetical protein